MAESVVVVRKPGKDNFGRRLPGEPARWTVPGFQFAPGPSQEVGVGAGQVETDGTLYGPPKVSIDAIVPTGIQPTDHIDVRGDLYQVVGRVQDWGASGTVIVLKLVTG
ncbi:hypothetical protein AB0F93_00100 [Micromonospora tulbaghiae]|uniref:hypothetical protein n=1 Tax=Micromonospora tulbaghiae TaxID=479978 RepID=UPI00331CC025